MRLLTLLLSNQRRLLTLFTKQKEPCSLCDKAKLVLREVQREIPFTLEMVAIDAPGNEKWLERYQYDIPVIHIDGKYVMKHTVQKNTLRHSLQSK